MHLDKSVLDFKKHEKEALKERLSARALLRYALKKRGIHQYTVLEDENDKPFLKENVGIHFSISHTRGLSACVLSKFCVGLDVEKIRADYRPAVAKKVYTNSEIQRIDTPKDFYKLWTLKESYIKAIGLGFRFNPKYIEFDLDDLKPIDGYHFFLTELHGCSVACARKEHSMPKITELSIDDLTC
jgi:4'-phosphopantetheinyl transferase